MNPPVASLVIDWIQLGSFITSPFIIVLLLVHIRKQDKDIADYKKNERELNKIITRMSLDFLSTAKNFINFSQSNGP